jgi:hypothetical protein
LAADDPSAPSAPVRLIFAHHSTGENWLSDGDGRLGIALRNNNYFVSDTNYGWGPGSIGDTTDIGHWWLWFRSPSASTVLAALYAEEEQHCGYSRLATNPGGENEIIMFKSCFPNSGLQGSPSDPVPAIGSNPLRGEACWSSSHTVANAKGIYIDLLSHFAAHQEKLFVVIAAPPLQDGTWAANARAFNLWLVNDWLAAYPHKNVFVFDFYNVLTTNGGSPSTNDLGASGGNHHRWWSGAVQHKTDGDDDANPNVLEYPAGDDHPSQAGNLKATAEFVPLLNVAYHRWKDPATTETSTYVVDRTGIITTQVALKGYLKRTTDNAWLVGKTLWFRIDGADVGSAATDALGNAILPWTITAGPASRTILVAFNGDAGYSPSSGTAALTAQTVNTKLFVPDRPGKLATYAVLRGHLLQLDNTPVVGKPISFKLDGADLGSLLTDATGRAQMILNPLPDGPGVGTRVIRCDWAGDAGYRASTGSAAMTVTAATVYIWVLSRSVKSGGPTYLRAYVRRLLDYQWQAGKLIRFRLDGTDLGSSATDAAGVASLYYVATASIATHTLRMEFDGDSYLAAGAGEGTLNIVP